MLPSSSVRCLSSPFAADASCSHSCPFSSNRVHLPVVSPVLLQQLSVSEPESLNCRLRSSLSCGAQLAAPTSHLICSKETHENGRPVFVFFEDLSKRKAGIIASSAALREAVQLSADEGSSESGSIKKGRNKLKRSDADSLKKKEGLNSPNSQVQANESGNDPSEKKLNRLPINLDLSLYRAKCLFRKRQYAKAEAILRQCIKDWPTDGRPYVTLGTRLVKLGRFVEARAVYEEGCQATRGENPYVWQAWAILEQKQGHVAQARRLFDASTAADIKHASAWHGWAVLELQQGSIRKARDLLTKGLKFCGPNEYLYQTLALIECRAGKDEDARVLFSQAVSCNPKSCASWLAWALMEAEKGNVSTARYLFQRSIRASPKNRFTWQAWALFEASKGKKEWARRLFERGIELNPDDAVLLQAFALFEYDSSNPDRARELFKLASIKDPEHQPVWNAWGWMEWKENNLELAREYYRKALAINTRTPLAARTYHAWAIMEKEADNFAAARELFKYALRVDPQNIRAWESWEQLEESLGNKDRAEEIRTQSVQQRVEVVDEAPWDISLSSMLAPAINRIKDFFKIQAPSVPENEDIGLTPDIVEVLKRRKLDMEKVKSNDDFDLESFIKEVLPSKSVRKSDTSRQKRKPVIVNKMSSAPSN
ncbi:hypothetical protein KP509_13G082500 [Ceratopteris richardii]|uniref:PsbB mRNA maturation factor Mbb1 n=1 Tax=Ceratopteris richardii TaxID=49495 RepID=A0A8T2THF2_CERRI|nr:hypothetical protein KP509_13G082500 [Ceratopteris richardii]